MKLKPIKLKRATEIANDCNEGLFGSLLKRELIQAVIFWSNEASVTHTKGLNRKLGDILAELRKANNKPQ